MIAISLSHCRITIFHFVVEDTHEKPTVTFMGEQPNLQYVSGRVQCIHSMELINSYIIYIPSLSFVFLQNFLVTGKCIGQPNYVGCKYWVLLTHATKGSLSFTHCCVYCGYVMWLELRMLLNFFYSCRKKKQEHNVFPLYYCDGVVWTCTHVNVHKQHMWRAMNT